MTRAGWAGCLVALAFAGAASAVELRLIGVQSVPTGQAIDGTTVGGLSGLDYDAAADRWVAVSDDKREHGPARFYTVKLDYDARGFTAARVEGMTVLEFPAREAPDLEALRLDPRDGRVWTATEGDAAHGYGPSVRIAQRNGKFVDAFPLPAQLQFDSAKRRGPRLNLNFEGLAFAPDGESLWVALEAPLIEDGPVASQTAGAVTRLTQWARDGAVVAQFAYALDAWPLAPAPGRLADNGVAELLALDSSTLLVLERGGAQDEAGRWRYAVRLFAASVARATDVRGLATLRGASLIPAEKRVVFDFTAAGLPRVDNLEGLAWGRRLANGHATLVAVSDDNFSVHQSTQFWVFEVIPSP